MPTSVVPEINAFRLVHPEVGHKPNGVTIPICPLGSNHPLLRELIHRKGAGIRDGGMSFRVRTRDHVKQGLLATGIKVEFGLSVISPLSLRPGPNVGIFGYGRCLDVALLDTEIFIVPFTHQRNGPSAMKGIDPRKTLRVK